MPHTQTWMIDGKLFAPAPIRFEHTHGQLHSPRSYAFACPHCGEVWARRIITPDTRWFFWTAPCRKCAARNDNSLAIPGSIYVVDAEFLDNLPLAVLQSECQTLCAQAPIPATYQRR
jgi:predicted RNA-binding Zn-ribbon protein involved in translation (DUF1610 family)